MSLDGGRLRRRTANYPMTKANRLKPSCADATSAFSSGSMGIVSCSHTPVEQNHSQGGANDDQAGGRSRPGPSPKPRPICFAGFRSRLPGSVHVRVGEAAVLDDEVIDPPGNRTADV